MKKTLYLNIHIYTFLIMFILYLVTNRKRQRQVESLIILNLIFHVIINLQLNQYLFYFFYYVIVSMVNNTHTCIQECNPRLSLSVKCVT